ncbi:MAG: UvrD-helicase domain-containing protein [candidate division Zixibacteria bacterium]|nr:UvrD-helicase domain-containing protein [candidate division Zixibacteria bacterium]
MYTLSPPPAPRIDPETLLQWERKGRGMAVFRCPETFSLSFLEKLPGSCTVTADITRETLTGTESRILLKLAPPDFSRLHTIVHLIVLPAYYRLIPLYAFMPWGLETLAPVALPVPTRAGMQKTFETLCGEQLRTLLACMGRLVSAPEAIPATDKASMTPVERYLAVGLNHAGLPFRREDPSDPYAADFLLTTPDGRQIAVETDGRGFRHETQRQRDAERARRRGLETLRLDGRQILQNRDGCIAVIRQALQTGISPPPTPEPQPTLSPEQTACLAPLAGAILTLAPAGSGKTRVLTRRVVEAVRQGTAPERILCVVFNRAASEVMAERIHDRAGLSGLRIGTLHSLGYEICRLASDSPYAGFQVATPQNLPGGLYRQYRQAIREDMEIRRDGSHPRFFPEHLVVAYEEMAARRKRTLDTAAPSSKTEGFDAEQAERVRKRVETVLSAKKLLTYDDQIYRAVEVLLGSPDARARYQSLFDAVLVDEVQDLTPAQFLLVRLIAFPHDNLFAVGDDDQMINTFTGADPANIRAFGPWYPGASLRTLGENYRCAPDIVARSARVIACNRNRFPKPIRPAERTGMPSARPVEVIPCVSVESEAKTVAHRIRRWMAEGYSCRDMAVLVRVKSIASPVQFALKACGIPFSPLEETKLYGSSVGLVIGAYMEVIRAPERASYTAWVRALATPSRYLSNDHLRAVAAEGAIVIENPDRLPPFAQAGVASFLAGVRELNAQRANKTASWLLDRIIDRFGIAEYFRIRERHSRHPVLMTSVDIIELFREMASGCRDIDTFAELCRQRVQEESSLACPAKPQSRQGVTVTTIHRSKGDEYRCVVLFRMAEHILPHRHMMSCPEDLEEERRVFYAAVTRAIEHLCITTGPLAPSRFLREMDRPHPARRKFAAIRENLPLQGWLRGIRRLIG